MVGQDRWNYFTICCDSFLNFLVFIQRMIYFLMSTNILAMFGALEVTVSLTCSCRI